MSQLLAARVLDDSPFDAGSFARFDAAGFAAGCEAAGLLGGDAGSISDMLARAKAAAAAVARGADPRSALASQGFTKSGGGLTGAFRGVVSGVAKVAPAILSTAAQVAAAVPGIGTVGGAALNAAAALAQGKRIDQVALAAARGALPPGARQAFDVGAAVASGKSLTGAALGLARAQLPPAAQQAFDVAQRAAQGGSLSSAAMNIVRSNLPAAARDAFDKGAGIATAAREQARRATTGVAAIGGARTRTALPRVAALAMPSLFRMQGPAAAAARLLQQRPSLRSLPISQLAPTIGVSPAAAKQGMAALISAMRRTASGDAGALDDLRPDEDIARALSPSDSFDAAAPRWASAAAAPRRDPRSYGARRGARKAKTTRMLALVPAARALPLSVIGRFTDASGPNDPLVKEEIREAQARLARWFDVTPSVKRTPADYSARDADGVVGPRTRAAVKTFHGSGMGRTDDTLDRATLDVLRAVTPDAPGTATLPTTIITPTATPATATAAAASSSAGAPGLSKDEVRQAQLWLGGWQALHPPRVPADFGSSASEFDGIYGPRTQQATADFQRRVGAPRTDGILDRATFEAIDRATTPPAVQSPPPAPPTPIAPPPAAPPPAIIPDTPIVVTPPAIRLPGAGTGTTTIVLPPPPAGVDGATWAAAWAAASVGFVWQAADGSWWQKTAANAWDQAAPPAAPPPLTPDPPPPAPPTFDAIQGQIGPPAAGFASLGQWASMWSTLPMGALYQSADGPWIEKIAPLAYVRADSASGPWPIPPVNAPVTPDAPPSTPPTQGGPGGGLGGLLLLAAAAALAK